MSNIQGLVANQNNDQWQQMIGNWTPANNIPMPTSNPSYLLNAPPPNPTYYDYEQFKKTRIPSRDSYKDGYDGALEFFEALNKVRQSPMEGILDELFSSDEKLEYLLSVGYRELPNSSYLVKGEPDPEFKRTFTLEEAFIIEMKVKLKNILLSKQALKFKI